MIKAYYMLTKPGILMGNIITTAGGFALASQGNFNIVLFLLTMVGLCLIIGSACVFNNYTDRSYDAKMDRTKNRALVKGIISVKSALFFAVILAFFGFSTLYLYTNLLTASIALTGFFFYVVMYSFWKYRSTYGTLIGSIAGALPPVIGYCAVSNQFDMAAFLLFTIMVFWQMPHFYAIAMFRLKDYTAASIPVLPVKKGMHVTKVHMLFYTIGFIIVSLLPIVYGYTGYAYLAVISLVGLAWLYLCIKGFKAENDTQWARGMFRFSLVVIMAFSLMLGVSSYL
jgi:heme o synthase